VTTMTERPIVFVGSSLPITEARDLFPEFEVYPPIRAGDLRVLDRRPAIVAVIDGLFFMAASISCFEIMPLLKDGVQVLGGASMGALRAVELRSYGMHGLGRVYKWYLNGWLEDESAVAVAVHPDTFTSMSIPLVNVYYVLRLLQRHPGWRAEWTRCIKRTARSIYFAERTGDALRSALNGRLPDDAGTLLVEYLLDPAKDLKRLDAMAVLEEGRRLWLANGDSNGNGS